MATASVKAIPIQEDVRFVTPTLRGSMIPAATVTTRKRGFNPLSLDTHLWIIGILNVVVLAWQIVVLLQTRRTESMSLFMWIGFVYIQVTLALAGRKNGDMGQMVGMALSALCSTTVVVLILYFRWF